MKLKSKEAQVVALHVYPGEDGTTQVLEVRGHLTPSLAAKLQVKEACYTDENIPRNFDAFPSPSLRIDGADVSMEADTFRATLVTKFKIVKPESKKQHGVSLDFTVRIHFGGKEPVKFWVDNQNNGTFPLEIGARQQDLAFGEKEAEDEDEEPDAPPVPDPKQLVLADAEQAKVTKQPVTIAAGAGRPLVNHQTGSRRNRPPRDREREAIADGSGEGQVQ